MKETLEESQILNGATIKLLAGQEVTDLFSDTRFLRHWNNLFRSCPWATIFQGPGFVIEWTTLFHEDNIPILIYSHYNEKLTGLLTMTQSRSTGEITGTGKSDAHYHTWISQEHNKQSFIQDALQLLRGKFRGQKILLANLPPDAPIDWIKSDPKWNSCCELKPLIRPYVVLSPSEVNGLLKKKQFRENRNRLKRQGELRLEKITEADRFISVLDELALQYDFRQWATYNRYPFRSNPSKKAFYIRLFNQNLLNVTVLWLDDRIIASVVGSVGVNGWVHGAGFNTQCPRYARLSPGFLNFIMYAEQLSEASFEFLDLSTGAFSYKDRLATSSDTVYRLVIYPGPRNTFRKKAVFRMQRSLAEGLDRMNVDARKVKDSLKKNSLLAKEKLLLIKDHGVHMWMKNALLKMTNNKTHTYTIMENGAVTSEKNGFSLNINSTKDFMDFEPDGSLLTKWEFLYDCMKRMERGEVSFSWTSNGRLMACVWLANKSAKGGNTVNEPPQPEISMLHGLYVHQKGVRDLSQFFSQVKAKALENNPQQNLFFSAKMNLKAYCPNLETVHA